MESPDELRRAAVDVVAPSDASASEADEIIDLTDIVERGEIPAENGFRKENTDTGLELEKSEALSLDVLMADLRSGQSTAPNGAVEEFDLDSLLDGVMSQKESAKEASASQGNVLKGESDMLASDDGKNSAEDDEFDALLQDIVGEIEPSPGAPSDEGGEDEIGLDDLDSLLTSLGGGAPKSVSAASGAKEQGETQPRGGETSAGSTHSPHSDDESSSDLSLDELDNLLDSFEVPGVDTSLSSKDEKISERVGSRQEKTVAASSRAAGKNEPVFDPSSDESSQEVEDGGGLEDLDQLLDTLMTNEPEKRMVSPEPAGEMQRAVSSVVPEEMKEVFSGSEKPRVVPREKREAVIQKSDELNLDIFSRELTAIKSTCEAALAEAGARMTELEARLREEQEKTSRISTLAERLDLVDSRLEEMGKELGQVLASEKSGAEPDEAAIRAVVARELMSEDHMPPYAAALAERLDLVDSRLEEMGKELGQVLASGKSGAEPDEAAIRAVVAQELMSEDHMPPYAAALAERLDLVDSRLEEMGKELGQVLASEKSGAEPDEAAIRAVVAQELMSEDHMPPYVAALEARLNAVDSCLEELGQALASEKVGTEPDEEAIQAIVVRELMNESNTPSYVVTLTERLDAVDSRMEELRQALASEKAGKEPDEKAIQAIVTRELMSDSNTPPYVEGMVNELVNFENRIIALENRLEKQESSSEKAAAEAAARVIREEMSAMFAELGQSE